MSQICFITLSHIAFIKKTTFLPKPSVKISCPVFSQFLHFQKLKKELDRKSNSDYNKREKCGNKTATFIPVTLNNCLILNAGLSWLSGLGCCLSSCNVHKALHRDLCCSILFWMTMLARACRALTKYAVLQGDSISRKIEQYWWPYKISFQSLEAVQLPLVCSEHFHIYLFSSFLWCKQRGEKRENFAGPNENQPVNTFSQCSST